MPKLIIETKKIKHDLIEVEIDGKIYSRDIVNTEFIEKAGEFEKAAMDGDLQAGAKMCNFLLGVPLKAALKIDLRQLKEINEYVMECVWFPEKNLPVKKKKNESPGDTKSQK